MSLTVRSGDLVTIDPSDWAVITFDWDTEHLPAGAQIAPAQSVFTIVALKQAGATALTKDNEAILTGNRKTRLRLVATTASLGDRYRVDNKILTDETPPQQKERSFFVVIQNK